MSDDWNERTQSLGRELRLTKGDDRLVELARVAANVTKARAIWERDGDCLVVRVKAGKRTWALQAKRGTVDAAAMRALLRQAVSVNLVHDATGCSCATERAEACPAFMAFAREADA